MPPAGCVVKRSPKEAMSGRPRAMASFTAGRAREAAWLVLLVAGHDVAEAAGHGARAFQQDGDEPLPFAGLGDQLADDAEHLLLLPAGRRQGGAGHEQAGGPAEELAPGDWHQRPSAVVGSMMVLTSETLLAGKPPFWACSRTMASLGAM
jgi:hypothetical protein